uniref:Putative sodium-coupled neutral amino acid transporter 10 n=1 Tax=Lygus hesperus TaxID=30085 RepID=A0A0A9WTZ8_LYGHE
MVPVIIPKRINSIRYVSAVGVSMLFYFVIVIVAHSCTNGLKYGKRGDMQYFTTGNQAIYALSIFIFAYMCQLVTPSVYLEQRPKPSIRQLTWASILALSFCTILYILAGIFGYFDFADDTQSSVLSNFDPIHQPYVMVAYVGMMIKLSAAYAMNMLPCRNFVYFCLRWELSTVSY